MNLGGDFLSQQLLCSSKYQMLLMDSILKCEGHQAGQFLKEKIYVYINARFALFLGR